jgi:PhnB protein
VLRTSPFLLFDGNCAEAMTFYQSCLGGELTITRLADTPMVEQAPPELHDRVAYARLVCGEVDISATDWQHQTRRPRPGNTVAIYLNGDSYAELQPVFDALAEGGDRELLDDLRDLPFGVYGHLADRYGVHWFFRGERAATD